VVFGLVADSLLSSSPSKPESSSAYHTSLILTPGTTSGNLRIHSRGGIIIFERDGSWRCEAESNIMMQNEYLVQHTDRSRGEAGVGYLISSYVTNDFPLIDQTCPSWDGSSVFKMIGKYLEPRRPQPNTIGDQSLRTDTKITCVLEIKNPKGKG